MAGSSLNTQKLTNVVDFKVDKRSFNAAKKSLEDLKKFSEGIKPSIKMTQTKKDFKEMEKYAKSIAKHMQNARNGGAGGRPPVPPTPPPAGGGRGGRGGRGGSGGGRGGRGGRGGASGSRAETAQLRRENFLHRSGQLTNVGREARESATKAVEDAVKAYEEQRISASKMNQVLAIQLSTLRRIHRQETQNANDALREMERRDRLSEAERKAEARREAAAAREAERRRIRENRDLERRRRLRNERWGRAGLGLSPGLLAGSAFSIAAIQGISRIKGNLSESADRINYVGQAAKNVEVNPNVIQALTAWGQSNGVDSANMTKSVDQIKDIREKLASSVTTSELNKKGEWTKGNAGVNEIMNQFGWNLDDIKSMQHNPIDFLQSVVNAGQQKGLSDGQIGNLLENLGDDLSHFVRAFKNNGQGLLDASKSLVESGSNLTDSQVDAAHRYVTMGQTMDKIEEGLSNKFLDGFVNSLDPETVQEFQQHIKNLGPSIDGLGHLFGDLINGGMKFSNWMTTFADKFNFKPDGTPKTPGQQYGTDPLPSTGNAIADAYGTGMGDGSPSFLKRWANDLGWIDPVSLNSAPISSVGQGYKYGSLSQSVAMQQQSVNGGGAPIINIPSDIVKVEVNPSSAFGDILDVKIQDNQRFSHNSLIRDITSSNSSN